MTKLMPYVAQDNDNATVYTRFTRSDMRESSFTPGIPRYLAGGRGPGHSPIESPVDAQSHTDSYASDDTLSPGGLHNATALNSPSRRILGFLGTAHHISFLPQPAPTDAASATLSAGRPASLAARPLDGSVVMTGDAPSLPIQYPDLHSLTLSGLAASPVDISPAWSPMSPASGNHVSGVWHPIPFASSPTALATQPYPSEKQDTAGAQPSILLVAESPTVPLPSATFETDTPRTARDSRRRAEDGGISLAGGPHRPRSTEGPDAQSVLDSFDGGSYQTLPPAYGAY
ncbi:hypothetical protein EVJ58_g4509 [Rhodofomes roseus]|uniref:Uncharacterized protein n=1 Tax=Rhodofomes roseus TaxID=34475 RepID=A0A4Y9YHX3_9APHY|nr:hypothetical protein EVJ58_g4509 [Rhodofomes roseus]